MKYLITHSLLSAWLYAIKENPFEDAETVDTSMDDFMRTLRREPTEQTPAMKDGVDFENLVTSILNGTCEDSAVPEYIEPNTGEVITSAPDPMYVAAKKVADIVRGGVLQCKAYTTISVCGLDVLLYGRLDVLKGGHIYDIKFSKSYDRGKYATSTQHPTYLKIVPEAEDFTYIASNGTDVWTETYRRDETKNITDVVCDFINWLEVFGLLDTFKEHWQSK